MTISTARKIERIQPATGYHMPAEWAHQDAVWIAWPHNREDWPGKFAPIPWVYCEIVRLFAEVQTVRIVVSSKPARARIEDELARSNANLARVEFYQAATDRVWMRDSGPTFVVANEVSAKTPVALVGWRFNAWAKYENHKRDAALPAAFARWLKMPRFVPRTMIEGESWHVVMEGGAIDVNGQGALLATEECLLSHVQERNPGLGRDGIERVFADYLGVRKVIWLKRGIDGDDTHGHVDDLARFVDAHTVVTVVEPSKGDPNHEPLEENLRLLQEARDQDDRPLEVATLPMPRPVIFDGQRLPASYANFVIANGRVLVPTFNDPADRAALNILSGLFPGRDVIGVHAVDLVLGLGTLHCLTQQQPAATLSVR